ncbi:glycosyltransferase [Chroococcidiopsis sp.]|uniref:glycosyltransferase n=1 Tax=Chroococcidiopsis sp. TaxID=3088168 RepID=UPI003F419CEA
MHIVGRIKLPKSAEVAKLYLQCNDKAAIDYSAETPEVVFALQGFISTNSYFNSLYETFYTKYTSLDRLFYLLNLEGDFQVSVYREISSRVSETNSRQLLSREKFLNCKIGKAIEVELPGLQQRQAETGRIYFELECLSQIGKFRESFLATSQLPEREVSLAVVACTFQKEAFIKRTIKAILQDKLLQSKSIEILIVDNAGTLSCSEFSDRRTKLISHRNVGGSGGFTRGIVEALSSNRSSHILLLDDDIELESEAIYRVITLNEYARSDLVIAGSMLDLSQKHQLYEAGALYNKALHNREFQTFNIVRLHHHLDLQNVSNLNRLVETEPIDSAGFYFLSVPRKIFESIGLLLPLFLKVDDTEFCLRICEKFGNDTLITFPGIAVWHEPFFAKSSIWNYYYYRNDLIVQAMHGTLRYADAIAYFTKAIVSSLLVFDYKNAQMLIHAFEDYLQGAKILQHADPEQWHSQIVKLDSLCQTQHIQYHNLPSHRSYEQRATANFLEKLVSLLTLNGHFLPNIFTQDKDVLLWQTAEHADRRSRAFRKKRILIFKEGGQCLYRNELDKSMGIKLLIRWIAIAVKSRIEWSKVTSEWQQARRELTSLQFWRRYLKLEKSGLEKSEHQDLVV